ncbi:MAG: endonuclease [Elusimicrobia bacterium]|nr:endonuclease [Elusimicrobiota bacterium]
MPSVSRRSCLCALALSLPASAWSQRLELPSPLAFGPVAPLVGAQAFGPAGVPAPLGLQAFAPSIDLFAAALAVRPGLELDAAAPARWGGSLLPRAAFSDEEGAALLARVQKLAMQGHVARSYNAAKAHMFKAADHVIRDGRSGIVEVYSQTFVPGSSGEGSEYPENGDENGDGWPDREGLNAEHVWPQSFFSKRLPMRSDLHNLLPTFIHPNSLRGHLPFGEVQGRPEYANRAGGKLGGGIFEPPDPAKGRVARAMLYFHARYRDAAVRQAPYSEDFWNNRIELFLKWNREHLPTAEELRRNDLVAEFQGNRNPFIDEPSLADRIGAQAFRAAPRLRRKGPAPAFDPESFAESARMVPIRGGKAKHWRPRATPRARGRRR